MGMRQLTKNVRNTFQPALTDTVENSTLSLLKGKKVLVTAGPTQEAIDPVRYVSNHSSGKMGYALAKALHESGADVTLISGPTRLAEFLPQGKTIHVTSGLEMLDAAAKLFAQTDIAIFAAAVADYRPERIEKHKLKKKSAAFYLKMVPNPDIAFEFSKCKSSSQMSVGFALETNDLLENAREKLARKGFDFIVMNSANEAGAGFGVDTNRIAILTRDGRVHSYGLKQKSEVAGDIIAFLVDTQIARRQLAPLQEAAS